jgi:hypothetical protein
MTALGIAHDILRAIDPSSVARDLELEPDPWQRRLIDEPPKRALVNCGRQCGKSTAASLCALHRAVYAAPATVVLISPSMRQSIELYRTLRELWSRLPNHPEAQYETLSRLELTNGSRILSLPGSEATVRGIAAVDLIIVDEAARVPDELITAIRPMLAVSDGSLFALSTPAGKRGWWYEAFVRGVGWTRISVKSTDCPRISKAFLDEEREALGPVLFSQEYECTFHDESSSAFLTDLIDAALTDAFAPFLPRVSA